MAKQNILNQDETTDEQTLESGAYEIIRKRLLAYSNQLFERVNKLNEKRKEAFGVLENKIIATDRIITDNTCVARDMFSLGNKLLFGYNVFIGLKKEMKVSDVFSLYEMKDNSFSILENNLLNDQNFIKDFHGLYQYYRDTSFNTFIEKDANLFMIFQTGKSASDIRIFTWQVNQDNTLTYAGSRSAKGYSYPPQIDFEWIKTTREQNIYGRFPHVSIEDKVFVESVGGDITIKVEDNTEDGNGIYSEEVIHKEQTLDDADIYYSIMGHIILLKILPYQEKEYRYFIFNEKTQKVVRVDDIRQCAIRLPEDDGLIFPKGYYLKSGDYKAFSLDVSDMSFLKLIISPNGEDYLYIFYNEEFGEYILLQYNIISKKVDNPLLCHGFSIYDNGKMVIFKGDNDSKKSHAIQIWQTPFVKDFSLITADSSSHLSKIGNKELVKGIADLRGIYNLLQKSEVYLGIYHQIAKEVTNAIDLHFWLDHKEAFAPKDILLDILTTANDAIDEYEKVVTIRENTEKSLSSAEEDTNKLIDNIKNAKFLVVDEYVDSLTKLQIQRGHIISLKDLRYVEVNRVDEIEKLVGDSYDKISQNCVNFLLEKHALSPFFEKLKKFEEAIPSLSKVTEIKKLSKEINKLNNGVDLLTDITNSLKIEDSTQTSQIIDNISNVYIRINQVKAIHKKHYKALFSNEAKAEFSSQFKLINQSVTNFIDQADTVEKCEELLTKVMVQIESLEGKFSDFEDYIEKLTEKRNEVYSAFDNRKVQLQESLNRKTISLWNSADRILKGISNRTKTLKSIDELNGYFASDMMIAKVKDIVKQLFDLGDSVKSEEVVSRLKSLQQDGARQLKDRLDLFEHGGNIITFGSHKFTVNTQAFDLTTVNRNGSMYYHLTGTEFFEKIKDNDFNNTKRFWQQEWPSETKSIYRAEYLAYKFLTSIETENKPISKNELKEQIANPSRLLQTIRDFMSGLYDEGYEKGVHDEDACKILTTIHPVLQEAGILRFHPSTRAYGAIFWYYSPESEDKTCLREKIKSFGYLNSLTDSQDYHQEYAKQLRVMVDSFFSELSWPVNDLYLKQIPDFLLEKLKDGSDLFPITKYAYDIYAGFIKFLKKKDPSKKFIESIKAVGSDLESKLFIIQDWLFHFVKYNDNEKQNNHSKNNFLIEAISLLTRKTVDKSLVKPVNTICTINGIIGQHSRVDGHTLKLDISDFIIRLNSFYLESVPSYKAYVQLKRKLTEAKKEDMRLNEFKPKVMSSFVRNRLIDSIYIPLIGTNLAKQMGAFGGAKRTDLMGLLMLISPPGYGKTTLMEYISNRLGIIFMKINGPAIGNQVSSLDPDEAVNATAREEVEKLNLAFEMANNVMIYLDDIQHCNPEFLQKFISLCDAQRKIEGVYNGRTKTYDLRGKKVAVVMAGNPYTESGEKFRVPDMLANRADTYNLGDIIGGNAEVFNLSYLENCLTSNTVLNKLASRSQHDIYEMIKIAKTNSSEGIQFEKGYSMEEVKEFVNVFKKLLVIQDVILKVNQQYIYSAAQDDDYRTEPNFLLQGSYRNMNKMAEKVVPIMNEEELNQLIMNHYTDESQLLTTGAEFNLLRFKELIGWLSQDEAERLSYIRSTYKKGKALGKLKEGDAMTQISGQISLFNDRFDSLVSVVEGSIGK